MDIILREDQYLELEKIGLGVFSPLDHFMKENDFIEVCNNMRLKSGDVFPIPILFDVSRELAKSAKLSDKLNLFYKKKLVGNLYPESIFSCNKSEVSKKIYGTDELNHPGVKNFFEINDWFIGGKTVLLERVLLDFSKYELTPNETKKKFKDQNWKTIVGFQTRNVPHRAHEYLQRVALENVDGLFIQPLVGKKKPGDYTPNAIINGYETLISDFFPANKVFLSILSTSMRYAGPREAVFHAIIRKNYGCTHFIVGRDHAGVGSYYEKYAAHKLLKSFESELDINIFYFHGPFYCKICDGIVTEQTCKHIETDEEKTFQISGTMIRDSLSNGVIPDTKYFRNEIYDSIIDLDLFI
tara:strand:+ start:996 stop:2060 length:1065 start_codon:yes stop_codon:yes gene_type:complete